MTPRVACLAVAVAVLVSGATATMAQRPQDTAVLSGVVVDGSGAVIPGATVAAVLQSGDPVSVSAVTDAQGRFRLTGLPAGSYRVTASVRGFATVSQVMRAASGETSTIRLVVGGRSQPPTTSGRGRPNPRPDPAPAPAPPPPPPPPPPPAPEPAPPPPVVQPSAPSQPSAGAAPPGSAAPPASPAGPAAPDGSAVVSVFYATDRERLPGPVLNYGPARNRTGALDLGRFDVSVPRDHERGTLERPDIWTFWKEDPARHFLITRRTQQSYDAFYGDIRDRIARAERKDAFVFVHGFNVAFEDAVYRTAQFAYDLQVPIAPILYSWPSAATLSPIGYSTDAESNRWTERHLRWFLEDVLAKTGAARVHLVAHSMGNKALVNALDMMPPTTTRRFGQIILTAPDIDADQFVQLAAAVRRSGERATLYASANDIALSASKRLQGGYRRAGDVSGGVVVVPGIDTIDVSMLKTDFLGHSPQGEGSVISDIFLLLTQGLAPGSRPGLRSAGTAPSLFWRFVP